MTLGLELVILSIAVLIMFTASRALCESLEIACDRWSISESVAGATVLSMGGSIPEIIVNVISTTRAHSQSSSARLESLSIGFGAILGSGLIAFLLIPGICLTWSPIPLRLNTQPLLRDCSFYLSMLALIVIGTDYGVSSRRSALVLLVYIGYLTFLFNTSYRPKMEVELFLITKTPPNPLPRAALALAAIAVASMSIMAVVNHWVALLGNETSGFFGLCLVALAAEIPDAVNAFSAASLGHGEMALAGCLGAQITNMALGLAGPLLALSLSSGANVNLKSPVTSAAAKLLMGNVLVLSTLVSLSPSKGVGLTLIFWYVLCVAGLYWTLN